MAADTADTDITLTFTRRELAVLCARLDYLAYDLSKEHLLHDVAASRSHRDVCSAMNVLERAASRGKSDLPWR